MDRYRLVEWSIIGKGSSGAVASAIDSATGETVRPSLRLVRTPRGLDPRPTPGGGGAPRGGGFGRADGRGRAGWGAGWGAGSPTSS